MKLLYIWIKDYSCLKQIGMNFYYKYKFSFDYNKCELGFLENNISLDHFLNLKTSSDVLISKLENKVDKLQYKPIDSLLVIVGNNGAGKTTVLELICNVFTGQLDLLPEGIYCLEQDNKIYIHSTLNKDITLKVKGKTDKHFFKCCLGKLSNQQNSGMSKNYKLCKDDGKLIKCNSDIVIPNINLLIEDINVIYFSNEFNSQYIYKRYKPIIDISTSGLLSQYHKDDVENSKIDNSYGLINCYNYNEMLKQIDYVCSSDSKDEQYLDFKLPERVFATFRDNSYIIMNIYKRINTELGKCKDRLDVNRKINEIQRLNSKTNNISEEDKLAVGIYKIYDMFNMNNIHDRLNQKGMEQSLYMQFNIEMLLGIFTAFLYENIIKYMRNNQEEKNFYQQLGEVIMNNLENKNDLLEHDALYDFFIKLFEDIFKIKQRYKEKTNNEFIKCIQRLKNELSSDVIVNKMAYTSYYQQFILETKDSKILTNIEEFYKLYKVTSLSIEYLDFSWGVSSGEYNMISLFARIHSLVENWELKCAVKNTKNLMILIDEADLAYHPEWQQKYIKNLLIFLKEKFLTYNIQIILTTHSPILLSDIPKENIIFLKKVNGVTKLYENKEETFGANIYDLYRNGFFLKENNYGIIGDFSTYTINQIKNLLDNINNDIDVIIDENKNENNHINIYGVISDKYLLLDRQIEYCKKVINMIGEKFIKRSLMKLYNEVYSKLYSDDRNLNIDELEKLKKSFSNLSKEEQDDLIRYIIQQRD